MLCTIGSPGWMALVCCPPPPSFCDTHTYTHTETYTLIPTHSDNTGLRQSVYVGIFVCISRSRQRVKRLEFIFLWGFCLFYVCVRVCMCLFTCPCVFASTVACLPVCSPHPTCVCYPGAGVPPLPLTITLSLSFKSPHCLGGQTFEPLPCCEACSEWWCLKNTAPPKNWAEESFGKICSFCCATVCTMAVCVFSFLSSSTFSRTWFRLGWANRFLWSHLSQSGH